MTDAVKEAVRQAIDHHRNGAHAGADEEDEPDALDVPPYPVGALGPELAELVGAYAAATKSPLVLAAMPALAVMATVLGPRWRVGPRGFIRAPRVWAGLVAPSGAAKTPTADLIWLPLHRLDRRLGEEHEHELELHEQALQAWEERPKKSRGSKPQGPGPRRRWIATADVTPEGFLRDALGPADGHGVLWCSDELPQWLSNMDGYRQSGRAGRGAMLSLWSGQRIVSLRAGRDAIEVDDPFAIVVGGVQPSVLGKIQLEDGDGLAARFCWAIAPIDPGGLGPGVSDEDASRWAALVGAGARAGQATAGPIPFEAGAVQRLDALIREWRTMAGRLERAGMGLLAAAVAKAPDHLVRLIAALHGADLAVEAGEGTVVPRPVPLATLARAEELVRWHLVCARRVVELVAPKGEERLTDRDAELLAELKRVVPPGAAVEISPAEWVQRLRLDMSGVRFGKAMRELRKAAPGGWLLTRAGPRQRSWRVERIA